jgi:hypothetical protein
MSIIIFEFQGKESLTPKTSLVYVFDNNIGITT